MPVGPWTPTPTAFENTWIVCLIFVSSHVHTSNEALPFLIIRPFSKLCNTFSQYQSMSSPLQQRYLPCCSHRVLQVHCHQGTFYPQTRNSKLSFWFPLSHMLQHLESIQAKTSFAFLEPLKWDKPTVPKSFLDFLFLTFVQIVVFTSSRNYASKVLNMITLAFWSVHLSK